MVTVTKNVTVTMLFLFPLTCLAANFQKVCINNTCIEAEIAVSPKEREEGLMFRSDLSENQGMLFVFDEEAAPKFWMKNMRFPLDIIWVDKDKKIVEITRNALPCVNECLEFVPREKVRFVLEVNSGFAEKNNIQAGQRLDF